MCSADTKALCTVHIGCVAFIQQINLYQSAPLPFLGMLPLHCLDALPSFLFYIAKSETFKIKKKSKCSWVMLLPLSTCASFLIPVALRYPFRPHCGSQHSDMNVTELISFDISLRILRNYTHIGPSTLNNYFIVYRVAAFVPIANARVLPRSQ